MAEKKGFDLGDYIEVKDRIRVFYELYGQGRLVTGEVRLTTEPDGKPRVMVQGLAYRTPDDPLPGVGWSWLELPGTTPYTKGSEIENAETSAWGRAIGSLGILIDKSIASAQEVKSKETNGTAPKQDGGSLGVGDPGLETTHDGGLVGKAVAVGTQDFELRESPEGWTLPFRVKEGNKTGVVVLAHDDLAKALRLIRDAVLGQRVIVWGKFTDEPFTTKTGHEVSQHVLHLERIQTPDAILPAPDGAIVAPVEAPSGPLGLVDDDLSDLPEAAWIASEASDLGSRR